MCIGIVRFQFQCPAVAGGRFVQFSLVLQRIAQIVVCRGIVGFHCDGAIDVLNSKSVIAGL